MLVVGTTRGTVVSIHAPARGATRVAAGAIAVHAVSIHAPARGATFFFLLGVRGVKSFNPRAREGRDHPRHQKSTREMRFNPRAREGRDLAGKIILRFGRTVSIHAPARGATIVGGLRAETHGVSIHAPARGATADRLAVRRGDRVSIHAPARGATRRGSSCGGARHVSIHAPARGATFSLGLIQRICERFNPRAREGRDARGRNSRPPTESFNPRAREGRDSR